MSRVIGATERRVALDALVDVADGAASSAALNRQIETANSPKLNQRSRGFITELVHGATRMRRAVDFVVDRRLNRSVEPRVRAALRSGAYELLFMNTPAFAAVNATVEACGPRGGSLVNAVLRKVGGEALGDVAWPSDAVRHSYPDWIWRAASDWWGRAEGRDALAAMNVAQKPVTRADGYRWGQASAWVAAEFDALAPGGRLLIDLCAAPGGKLTGVERRWRRRVGVDVSAARVSSLAVRFADQLEGCVVADGRCAPFDGGRADAVLVDAPCSGLGALGRRSDARWRIQPEAVDRLTSTQRGLVADGARLLASGGTLLYSVCTFSPAETTGVADWVDGAGLGLEPLALAGDRWRAHGRGGIVLPHDFGTDAMAVFAWRKR